MSVKLSNIDSYPYPSIVSDANLNNPMVDVLMNASNHIKNPCLKYEIYNKSWILVDFTSTACLETIKKKIEENLPECGYSDLYESYWELKELKCPVYLSTRPEIVETETRTIFLSNNRCIEVEKGEIYDPWYRSVRDFRIDKTKLHSLNYAESPFSKNLSEARLTTSVESIDLSLCILLVNERT